MVRALLVVTLVVACGATREPEPPVQSNDAGTDVRQNDAGENVRLTPDGGASILSSGCSDLGDESAYLSLGTAEPAHNGSPYCGHECPGAAWTYTDPGHTWKGVPVKKCYCVDPRTLGCEAAAGPLGRLEFAANPPATGLCLPTDEPCLAREEQCRATQKVWTGWSNDAGVQPGICK